MQQMLPGLGVSEHKSDSRDDAAAQGQINPDVPLGVVVETFQAFIVGHSTPSSSRTVLEKTDGGRFGDDLS